MDKDNDLTIEDVLDDDINACRFADDDNLVDLDSVISSFQEATEDGPVPSADGSLAVIRTDPELAKLLLELTKGTPRMDGSVEMFVRKDPDKPGQVGMVMPQRYVAALHRAALLAAPAPEEGGS